MKSRAIALIVALAAMLARAPVVGDEANDGIDIEGYVCTWLVLAPVPLKEGQDGADALDEESVTGEANVKPAAGDKLDVGGKDVTWKECRAKDQILDFNGLLEKQTENSVGYAVAYITALVDVNHDEGLGLISAACSDSLDGCFRQVGEVIPVRR